MKSFDLLGQRDFKESQIDFGFFLAAECKQCWQPRRCNAVGKGDTQLAMEAVGGSLHTVAGLLYGKENTGHVLQEQLAGPSQSSAATGADKKLLA